MISSFTIFHRNVLQISTICDCDWDCFVTLCTSSSTYSVSVAVLFRHKVTVHSLPPAICNCLNLSRSTLKRSGKWTVMMRQMTAKAAISSLHGIQPCFWNSL